MTGALIKGGHLDKHACDEMQGYRHVRIQADPGESVTSQGTRGCQRLGARQGAAPSLVPSEGAGPLILGFWSPGIYLHKSLSDRRN